MSGAGSAPRGRVLVVDDDRTVLLVLAGVLRRGGYEADVAASGREALGKIAADAYAAAVLDVGLGDMDGLEVLGAFRAASPDAVAIVLTGRPSDRDRARALRLGADLYATKPIKAEALLASLEGELRNRRRTA